MPRASFSDVSKGGFGFQEGRILILSSISTMYQYPPNSQTNEQSDAFPALVWKGVRVDDNGKPREDADGNPMEVEIVIRMGSIDEAGHYNIRPGKLDPKDFDNVDVEPEDLGTELDTVGNSFSVDQGAKFHIGWAHIEESLKKQGFKPEILGRCVTTDFEGLDALFGQQEGAPYIAKKGKMKGQEVKPSNLVCKRIFAYPYDTPKVAAGAKTTAAKKAAAGTKATTSTPTPGANGSAAGAGAGAGAGTNGAGDDVAFEITKVLFGGGTHPSVFGGKPIDGLSPEFAKAVPKEKAVKLEDFRKAMTSELMRRRINPTLNKPIIEIIKNEDRMMELAGWLMENDKPVNYAIDGEAGTIQFG